MTDREEMKRMYDKGYIYRILFRTEPSASYSVAYFKESMQVGQFMRSSPELKMVEVNRLGDLFEEES